MSVKKVCIIGAGASGLVGIKCCLEEDLIPVCYERADNIGGLWNYTNDSTVDGQGCVMKSTVINTSKEIMCYSDYPIPKDYPNFMHNTKLMKYFTSYAENFSLKKHIKLRHEILHVNRASDYDATGKWNVKVKNLETDAIEEVIYDGVLLCTGHHAKRYMPNFEGQDIFKGNIRHSHSYKDHKGYEDKRVLVVGIGNSGGDIAVELGRISQQVLLSTRRGSWVLNRVGDNGLPVDIIKVRRFMQSLVNYLPMGFFTHYLERDVQRRFDHELYSLKPAHSLFSQHPMVNDDLPNRIICGSVIIKPNVSKFTETGVIFTDGTFHELDEVVFATGYEFGFPFLESGIIDVHNNKVNLFKYVFPPDLLHSTIALIGCIQPLGAVNPISELQCRWACRIIKGNCHLPDKQYMWQDIREKQAEMSQRYVESQRHTIQVDFIPYQDELAEQIGCKPEISQILLDLKDPLLAYHVFFGPATPYHYRLLGPGKWKGAKKAILTTMDRVKAATCSRKCDKSERNEFFWECVFVLLQIMVVVSLAVIIQAIFL